MWMLSLNHRPLDTGAVLPCQTFYLVSADNLLGFLRGCNYVAQSNLLNLVNSTEPTHSGYLLQSAIFVTRLLTFGQAQAKCETNQLICIRASFLLLIVLCVGQGGERARVRVRVRQPGGRQAVGQRAGQLQRAHHRLHRRGPAAAGGKAGQAAG